MTVTIDEDGKTRVENRYIVHAPLAGVMPRLELREGDVVYVMEKCDDGWFVGTSQRSGVFGTFPGNYVAKA